MAGPGGLSHQSPGTEIVSAAIRKETAMKLDVRALSLASGTVAALLFTLCALFVALAPEATVWATRELFHVAVDAAPTITWGGAVSGILFWFVGAALTAAVLAGLYNRWART